MAKRLESEESRDVRSAVTTKIWGMATGMLAICIPLSAVTRSGPILPIAVIAGAATGTAVVWRSDKKSQNALLPHQLQQIEQRLSNLETIVGSDDLELRLKLKQLESSDRRA